MTRTARFRRFGSDLQRSVPIRGIAGHTVAAAYDSAGVVGRTLFLGVSPQVIPRCIPRIVGVWFVFSAAESGANDSNNTQVDFKAGANTASLTTFATLTTANNPAAGEPVSASVSYVPDPGQLIAVTVSTNGTGTTNFTNDDIVFGVEYREERFT